MISVLHLGSIDYSSALKFQEHLVDLRKENRIGDVLLLLEHSPVITLGRNANETNIMVSREFLAGKGVEVFEINRGGDVTFHGPGQLVGYPIFDLRGFPEKIGAVEYVRRIEEVLIRTCIHYGIETQRIKGMTGVWTHATPPIALKGHAFRRAETDSGVPFKPSSGLSGEVSPLEVSDSDQHTHTQRNSAQTSSGPELNSGSELNSGAQSNLEGRGFSRAEPAVEQSGALAPRVEQGFSPALKVQTERASAPERKIAAIGVHISRGVTSHGFALNVTTDLDYFKLIVPCGLTKPVTSIQFETGQSPKMEEILPVVTRSFGEVFKTQILWLESLDDLLHSAPPPQDTPMKEPEALRRMRGDDTHLA